MSLNLALSKRTEAEIQKLMANRPVKITEDGFVMTGPVRLSFAALDKPADPVDKNGKPKYQAALLFPHQNLGVLKEAVTAVLKKEYPGVADYSKWLNANEKNNAIKNQALKISTKDGGLEPIKSTVTGYAADFMYMNPKSMRQPALFHAVRGAWVSVLPEEITKVFYSGCWVEAKVALFKSTTQSNPGVATGLQALWKLADDNSFGGGGGASASEGGDVADAFEAEDPNVIPANDTAGDGW